MQIKPKSQQQFQRLIHINPRPIILLQVAAQSKLILTFP